MIEAFVLICALLSVASTCVALHLLTKPTLSNDFQVFATAKSSGSDEITFDQVLRGVPDDAQRHEKALRTISEAAAAAFAKGHRVTLTNKDRGHIKGAFQLEGPLHAAQAGRPSLGLRLTESYSEVPSFDLGRVDIHEIHLGQHTRARLELRNSRVLSVRVGSEADAVLRFQDCEIGEMELGETSVKTLVLRRCRVGRLWGAANAIRGSLSICANSTLFDYSQTADQSTVQGYRNLRIASQGHADDITEKAIHAEELRLERRVSEGPVFKALNYVFDACSHYGNAPNRALAVVGLLLLVSAAVVTVLDRPAPPAECAVRQLSGWHQALCDDGYWADLRRGIVLSLQTITNPLGIVSTRTMLVPTHLATSVLLALQSVASIVLLAIAVIGIRRRFRIS